MAGYAVGGRTVRKRQSRLHGQQVESAAKRARQNRWQEVA